MNQLPPFPQRIISLVPSQTELLYDLVLEERVVGITKFCVHPEVWFRTKARIGGTKNLNIEKVLSLQPDLVIANKEENVKEQVEALAAKLPVWVSDVNNLEDAYEMIASIGSLTNTDPRATELITKIKAGFNELAANAKPVAPMRCAYLIWKDPYMTAGGDTFINDMLFRCGLQNVFAHLTRYPSVTLPALQGANCQVVLLSSEPYPFKEKHIAEIEAALPGVKVLLVDGEMFSWYGSRLLLAPAYFSRFGASLPNPQHF
jgi:ABC-type Fe3+-hydroxamate transport system substrate-binding protein